MFQPIADQTFEIAQQSADRDPAVMSDDQIRQVMEAAPLMRQPRSSGKEALRRLEAGQSIPGLKLVNGRGSCTWALPEEEMAEKLVKMGIPKTAIYETKLVSPAKAEKLVWEKRDGTKVSLTPRQMSRMEQEYVSKMAGKLTVVPESDSRPAVVKNAAPMFSVVEAAPAAESVPLVAVVTLKGNHHVRNHLSVQCSPVVPHLAEPQRQVNEATGKERISYNCEFIMPQDHAGFIQFMQRYGCDGAGEVEGARPDHHGHDPKRPQAALLWSREKRNQQEDLPALRWLRRSCVHHRWP